MTGTYADLSQRRAVTILRILYPIWTVIGLFSLGYVSGALVVPDDPAATASNLAANELLYNLGILGSLLTQLIHIVVVLLLFQLFKSVNKNQASLIVVLGLISVPIAMFNEINHVAALSVLGGADYLAALTADQSQSLMMFFLDLNTKGVYIAEIFWGLWLFPIATLIYESKYFPKIIGHVLMVAGLGYVAVAIGHLLFPGAESILFQIFEVMTFGELIFMLWFVVRGARLPETAS